MKAIREIVKVKNRQVIINLPEDFDAEEVEVIILSDYERSAFSKYKKDTLNESETPYVLSKDDLDSKNITIPQWQIEEVERRTQEYLKNPESAVSLEDFLKEFEDDL